MTENIIQLTKEVQNEQVELEKVEMEVKELDKKYLKEVIQIAKKGIRYEKIVSEATYYNNCYDNDEIEYHYSKETNRRLMGIEVDSITLYYDSDFYGGSKKERQLFLLKDGDFMVFDYYAEWSNFQDSSSTTYRTISKNQSIDNFDVDCIVKSIERSLRNRLEKLGERKKTQLQRLEKLKQLQL